MGRKPQEPRGAHLGEKVMIPTSSLKSEWTLRSSLVPPELSQVSSCSTASEHLCKPASSSPGHIAWMPVPELLRIAMKKS